LIKLIFIEVMGALKAYLFDLEAKVERRLYELCCLDSIEGYPMDRMLYDRFEERFEESLAILSDLDRALYCKYIRTHYKFDEYVKHLGERIMEATAE
jgi:anion-transporting  ArsA/GET3 family ATPase